MEITGKMVREIRTKSLPKFLGADKVSQRQFGLIVSALAKKFFDVDMNFAVNTVQSWEYGVSEPGTIAQLVIDKIRKRIRGGGDSAEFGPEEINQIIERVTA